MSKVRVAGVEPESVVDGPGYRYVVFLQGCPHHCHGCHNPQTWAMDVGNVVDIDDIVNDIRSNRLIRGVTISGGEPMCQPDAVYELSKKLKELGYHVIMYTGYSFEDIWDAPTLKYIDWVIDGEFVQEKKSLCLKFRGSSNQRVIDVQKTLRYGTVVMIDL